MPYFFAVLERGIPLAKPYVVGYIGEKFGELGSVPEKREFASFGATLFHESMNEFNLIFSSGMEST